MNTKLDIQEVAIAIAAKNLNPNALNLDFLKYSDIIPADWELAKPPVYSNGLVQLLFNNGLSIVAQPNRVTLAEAVGTRKYEEVQVAKIANQLVEKLSQVEYQAVGINPRSFVSFDSEARAYQYLCNTLLSPGSWQELGEGRMSAALQLSYPLKRGQLNLSINQANIQFPEKIVAAILFSGNFNYPLSGNTLAEQRQDLRQLVQNWQGALETFTTLLTEKFLSSVEQSASLSIFPQIALPS
jgi:hypothetical protein